MKSVDIIIPALNEEGNIRTIFKSVDQIFKHMHYTYEIIFVDDGSTDHTLEIIKNLADDHTQVKYISFSRNFGHQSALKAGLDISLADCVISMDGDMQHPPELIPALLKKWEEGNEIVYTIRKKDKSIPYLKRKLSYAFYSFLNNISDTKVVAGAADFRLIDKSVVEILKKMEEYDLFIRGMVNWIGFKQYAIEYCPGIRNNGQSKYSFKKMFRFGIQGITSFSDKPLYLAAYLGFLFSAASSLYLPYALISYFFGKAISGWASIIVTVSFFGGLQLMILGIIGIYLGRLFMQSKKRPVYITKESNILWGKKIEKLFY
jgi:polyisoprenyl-phosphate glycosyltransferase